MAAVAPVITIDGPSSAGKGTLCKAMAKALQWNLLDSGAIYRVLALAVLHRHINVSDEKAIVLLSAHMDVHFVSIKGNLEVILDGKNVNDEIRTQEVANTAFQIASFPRVREALLHYQFAFRKAPGLIADGRDMGTVVFPDAAVKIFLDASPEERAHRRILQLQSKGVSVNFSHVFFDIKNRDNHDCNRMIAPLTPAKDALVLDSTNLTVEQVIKKALQYTSQKLAFA